MPPLVILPGIQIMLPDSIRNAFCPCDGLAASLLPKIVSNSDGSHDVAHIIRVWKNTQAIQAKEGGDLRILVAACLLHDCVTVQKNAPSRSQASRLAAARAVELLLELNWGSDRIEAICHAIEAHSFSAGIKPITLEARILQDADRLDAIGSLGVARCFYTGGRMGSYFYELADPDAKNRPLDDTRYVLDHFHTKLFNLTSGFQTITGARLARIREDRMLRFINEFREEAGIVSD
jgi:uncharacterized protein